ncbi:MAG: DUF2752 domain-containing protein [Bacteroidota bacterium]|jgi:DMSO/TMAO reductase YedYZ heme-binding membrane subunit
MLPCAFRSVFGVDCLGCGFQRSLTLLLKGQFIESVAMYPALIPFILFVLLLLSFLFTKRKLNNKWVYISGSVVLFIIVFHYILKITGNAPWYDAVVLRYY